MSSALNAAAAAVAYSSPWISVVHDSCLALSNFQLPTFYVQHGERQFTVEGKIGGDSDLSERGRRYRPHQR
jgi:hypothetical protein